MKKILSLVLAGGLVFGAALAASAQVEVDAGLSEYERTSGVSGNLNSIGSDTLKQPHDPVGRVLPGHLSEREHPDRGQGFFHCPPALIEGTAQLGPMSRQMKSSELDKFEQEFGYKPTPVKVAIDALAVFVHKDNPVAGLTLEQVDSIFSSTYKRGGTDIGFGATPAWMVTGRLGRFPCTGRNSASGTYGFFKSVALKKGDYKDTVKEQPGSSSVVQGVASDLGSVGYSGIGYKTSSVRALPLADQGPMYEPTLETV